MKCIDCQYDLSKLTEHRCPECGRWFDENDSSTYLSERWFDQQCARAMRWSIIWAFVPIAAIIAILFIAAIMQRASISPPSGLHDLMFLFLFVIMASIPVSFVMAVACIIVAMMRIWRGGWDMRKQVFARAGIVLGIWIGTIFLSGCFISVLAGG